MVPFIAGSVLAMSISSKVVAMCMKSDLRDRLVSLKVRTSAKVANKAPSANIRFGSEFNFHIQSEFTSATLPTIPANVDTDNKAMVSARLIVL